MILRRNLKLYQYLYLILLFIPKFLVQKMVLQSELKGEENWAF